MVDKFLPDSDVKDANLDFWFLSNIMAVILKNQLAIEKREMTKSVFFSLPYCILSIQRSHEMQNVIFINTLPNTQIYFLVNLFHKMEQRKNRKGYAKDKKQRAPSFSSLQRDYLLYPSVRYLIGNREIFTEGFQSRYWSR